MPDGSGNQPPPGMGMPGLPFFFVGAVLGRTSLKNPRTEPPRRKGRQEYKG
jgi:hypothetical protein